MLSFPVDGAYQHVHICESELLLLQIGGTSWTGTTRPELQIFVNFWHCGSAVVWCCLGLVSDASHQWHCASLFARFARWAWGFWEVLSSFHCKKNSSLFCRTNSSDMGKCCLLLIGVNWTKLRKQLLICLLSLLYLNRGTFHGFHVKVWQCFFLSLSSASVIQHTLLTVTVSWPSCYLVPTSTRSCSVEVSHWVCVLWILAWWILLSIATSGRPSVWHRASSLACCSG